MSVLACLASADVGATGSGTGTSETAEPDGDKPRGGRVTLDYKPSAAFERLFQALRDQRVLSTFVEHINDGLVVPKDLPVFFAECGESNAFYRSATGDITICYEIVQLMAQEFRRLSAEKAKMGIECDAEAGLRNAITFIFFHELGHALVDVYDLDITGREEDAVDGLATALLLHLEGGGVAAVHGATAFRMMSSEVGNDTEALPFWDEHSFGLQRFFNIGCWVYGKLGGEELRSALKAQGMQESRLNRCPTEFRRLKKSWKALLKPWLISDKSDTKGAK